MHPCRGDVARAPGWTAAALAYSLHRYDSLHRDDGWGIVLALQQDIQGLSLLACASRPQLGRPGPRSGRVPANTVPVAPGREGARSCDTSF